MADKRLSLEDLVGELRSGMTIGIGGWGSRRKPMAAVRAILRSDLTDLTVVSYGGPDVGLLCAAGKVAKVVFGFVTLDSIPTDPHFKVARQTGAVEAVEYDEGMFYLGLLAAAQRLPFLPTRAGLGSDVLTVNPSLRTVTSPYEDGEELVAVPALSASMPPSSTSTGPTHADRGRSSAPIPSSTSCSSGAADTSFRDHRTDRRHRPVGRRGPVQTMCISRLLTDGVVETPVAPTSPPASPTTRGTRRSRRPMWPRPRSPTSGPRSPRSYLEVTEADYQAATAGGRATAAGKEAGHDAPSVHRCRRVTRAEYCAIACAEVFRGDGEVMASAFGTAPALGARLARLTFAPDLVLTDGDAALIVGAPPLGADPATLVVESHMPYRQGVRRGVVGAAQPDHDGLPDRPHRKPEHQRHRRLGPTQGPAGRGAGGAGQHRQPPHQLLGAQPLDPVVRRAGRRGLRRGLPTEPRRPVPRPAGSTRSVRWSPISACSTSRRPTGSCGCDRSTPG